MASRTVTPLRAIRHKCVKDCCAGKPSLVRQCINEDCPLFKYKSGHNPARQRIGRFKPPVNATPLPEKPNLITRSSSESPYVRDFTSPEVVVVTKAYLAELKKASEMALNVECGSKDLSEALRKLKEASLATA